MTGPDDHPRERKPTIGLVVFDQALVRTIEEELETARLAVAFRVAPRELDGLTDFADVVVLVGKQPVRIRTLVERIREKLPEAAVLACIPQGEVSSVLSAIDVGLDGCVVDTRVRETLALSIRAVHAGQLVLPGDLREPVQAPELTGREKQVLSLVIMGLTNREISDKLFIAENTVKSHLNTAYKKLGVGSRAEATRRITDPDEGLGMGILALTDAGFNRSRGS